MPTTGSNINSAPYMEIVLGDLFGNVASCLPSQSESGVNDLHVQVQCHVLAFQVLKVYLLLMCVYAITDPCVTAE